MLWRPRRRRKHHLIWMVVCGQIVVARYRDKQRSVVNRVMEFKVCMSVHLHTIPINQPTRCNNFPNLLLDVYILLNMFRASSRPSSGTLQLQVAASGFTVGALWQQCYWSWSGRPRPTALLPPRSNGKTRGCYCSCWTPDDGCEDARNMLSSI